MVKRKSTDAVLALDLGTSSVRAVVYDGGGAMVAATLSDLPYKVDTQAPGQVSSDPAALLNLISRSVDLALKAARKKSISIRGIGVSCYWHSLMGVDRTGKPTTELFTWADTRSADETRRLRSEQDERSYHARTGCFFHASYWPAKLRWLHSTRPQVFKRTERWISLAEYLYQELFGTAPVTISIASGTGLLDVNRRAWDAEALTLAGIDVAQLSELRDWQEPCRGLRPPYAKRWPELRDLPWYLPLGDGALANVGAGCVKPEWACATIGTSSALRIITRAQRLEIPWGTFVYRLDDDRFVVGGALSEGGNVIRWFTDGLGIKHKKQLEKAAGALSPDSHGLTILPFWAGERSPNWRADVRAAIVGLSLGTQPVQLLRASMEAITYQLADVADSMERVVRRPRAVVATGGQLVHSAAWSQMLADTLQLPVIASPEQEASSRGAALLALHGLGLLPGLWSTTPAAGRRYEARARAHDIYEKARARQERLYALLFPPAGAPEHAPPIAAAESGSRKKDLRTPAARH